MPRSDSLSGVHGADVAQLSRVHYGFDRYVRGSEAQYVANHDSATEFPGSSREEQHIFQGCGDGLLQEKVVSPLERSHCMLPVVGILCADYRDISYFFSIK